MHGWASKDARVALEPCADRPPWSHGCVEAARVIGNKGCAGGSGPPCSWASMDASMACGGCDGVRGMREGRRCLSMSAWWGPAVREGMLHRVRRDGERRGGDRRRGGVLLEATGDEADTPRSPRSAYDWRP